MQEVWKLIPDFEDYEVSNSGIVRSLSSSKGKWGKELTPLKHKYLRVCLKKNKKSHWKSIHRLVALVYVANPENLPEVNHKDGNKFNNWDWNLEWTTPRKNKNHAIENALYAHGESHGRAKLSEEQVLEIYNYIKLRVRTLDIAEKYQVHKSIIDGIKEGKGWKYPRLPIIETRGLKINKKLLHE